MTPHMLISTDDGHPIWAVANLYDANGNYDRLASWKHAAEIMDFYAWEGYLTRQDRSGENYWFAAVNGVISIIRDPDAEENIYGTIVEPRAMPRARFHIFREDCLGCQVLLAEAVPYDHYAVFGVHTEWAHEVVS